MARAQDNPNGRDPTLPPHSLQAEEAVLGAVLKSPGSVVRVSDFLQAEDFYVPRNRHVFRAMLGLLADAKPIDYHSVGDRLAQLGLSDEAGGLTYVSSLNLATPTAAHIEHYGRIVERTALMRRLIAAAQDIAELAYRDNLDVDEALGKAERLVRSVTEKRTDSTKHEKRAKQAFVLTPLEQLLDEPEETVPYVVEGMLPSGGVSMFVAKPKVGKSTAARTLAFCVACGEPFLGRATGSGGPVIYLALEEKRAEVASHFRRMGATSQPILVHVGAAPASTADGMAALEAAILEHHAILAIADPALKLVRVRDASDYAEMLNALEPIVELARRTACHIGVCHHAGKLERPGGDDVLGSTALFGSVDTLVLMRRREYGRTLQTIQRYGQDLDESVIPLDDHSGLVQLGGDLESIKLAQASEAIKQVLCALKPDEDLDEATIRSQVEVASAVTVRALRALVADGSVTRVGGGKRGDPYRYKLAENTRFLSLPIYGDVENEKNEQRCEVCGRPSDSSLCADCERAAQS